MKYFAIEFLDEASTPGYMEVSEEMVFTRLLDVSGVEITELPHQSYRTVGLEPVEPEWLR